MYIKHEHMVVDILNHVQNQTMEKLLNENGSPNVSTIKRYLFDNIRINAVLFCYGIGCRMFKWMYPNKRMSHSDVHSAFNVQF